MEIEHDIFDINTFEPLCIGQIIIESIDAANHQEQFQRYPLRSTHISNTAVAKTQMNTETGQYRQ